MYCGQDFDVIQPDEVDDFTIDFCNDLKESELILSARCRLYVARTSLVSDPNPMVHILSPVFVLGTMTTVKIGANMIDGVLYGIEVQVMTNFNNLISLWSHIPCQELDWTGTAWMSGRSQSTVEARGSNVLTLRRRG